MASKQQIVDSIAAVARILGRAPTQVEFVSRAKISRHTVLKAFRTWNEAVQAAGLRPHRAEMPTKGTETQRSWVRGAGKRATYGAPLDFSGLRNEPVNEQGVVLLFGMLAKKLGYVIEAIQTGFPDCEAKRRISTE